MKDLSIITAIDFWRRGAGNRERLLSVIRFLADKTRITVLYLGGRRNDDEALISLLSIAVRLVYSGENPLASAQQYQEACREYFKQHVADVCIIEYINLSFLLPVIPAHVLTILDTHDLISERQESFRNFGFQDPLGLELSFEEETGLFEEYDFVMLINRQDYDRISKVIDPARLLLVPHAAGLNKHAVRKKVTNIGYIASEYTPNIDAIKNFILEVWPLFRESGVCLNIYGRVGHYLGQTNDPSIKIRGFIADVNTIYAETDIIINPVRFGAGLKIKNIEALSNGLPLVTTSHGAGGLTEGAGKAFLIADDKDAFYFQLSSLIKNFKIRSDLIINAFIFIKNYFSDTECYEELWKAIKKGKPGINK